MKIKRLLIGMLACSALVACTNDDLLENNEQVNQKAEEAYIAVNLKSAYTSSRAADDVYEDGTADENAVTDVTFFFFDANNEAYDIDAADGIQNYLVKSIDMNSNDPEDDNVEEISDEILVIEQSQKVPPQKILAILNAPAAFKETANLATLQGKYYDYLNQGKFIMSNSVYKHAATGDVVVATELAANNICATPGGTETDNNGALNNPVDIYVERVAAKVRVNINYDESVGETTDAVAEGESNTNTAFDTGVTTAEGGAIYAQILGWKVTNIKNQSSLLKKIDATWTVDALGFNWNDAPYYRSYWANTTTSSWNVPRHPWTWEDLNSLDPQYYHENTDANSADVAYDEIGNVTAGEHNKSQLLVAAQFVDENGSSIQIAEWYGQKYTIENLKVAIANAVKSQIFIKNADGTATSITDSDIDFFQEEATEQNHRYLAYAKLASASETKNFVGPDGTTVLSKETVNGMLNSVRPAKIWMQGGYYYMDIKHLAATAGKVGEFGLVRNHLYDITIEGITGLGTPVYDPEKIITPEKTDSDESFIAARINVLAWRVVADDDVILE